MTQTSKTSWGAKYSAKRITNTCKTPEEAAHAYDQYLKNYYPHKYAKFANFCGKCGQFVNPLGLPEYKSECGCTSPTSRRKELNRSVSSTSDEPTGMSSTSVEHHEDFVKEDESMEMRRTSNLSANSLKFSFSDDTEQFFEESFNMVSKMDSGSDPASNSSSQPSTYPPPLQKRDSLPLAVIRDAVESFTQEDNLDQIIKDINRTSSNSFSTKRPSFTLDNGQLGSIEPTSTNTTFVDFSMDELQDLSEYFLSDADGRNSGLQPEALKINAPGPVAYKKVHSLDFETRESAGMDVIKQEPAVVTPLAHQGSFVNASVSSSRPHIVTPSSSNAFPAVIEIQTPFLEKYWRNDRKNIQCFPYCPEHGDYYRVRIENLQHRCKGVCRAAVKARISIPTTQPLTQAGLLVLARCNSTFSRNIELTAQEYLNSNEIKQLQAVSAVGVIDKLMVATDGASIQFDVTFYPDVWKFEFDLPKKRRHLQANTPPNDPEADNLVDEFLYFFEVDVFYSQEKTTFQRLGHHKSISFQIGNTRTLLRQRNKMTDGANDGDKVLNADSVPEKKRMKENHYQKAADGSLSFNGSILDPMYEPNVDVKGIQEEDLSNDDTVIFIEPSKGGRKAPTAHEVWDEDRDRSVSDSDSADYKPHVSPKQGEAPATDVSSGYVVDVEGRVRGYTVGDRRPEEKPKPTTVSGSYSLPKMVSYSALCIPLSIIYFPLSVLLLIAMVIPPLASSVVHVLDTLSDSELRNANSSCIDSDTRYVLSRLDVDSESSSRKGALRFHKDGAVWSRFGYFTGGKMVLSVVAFVPALVLTLFSLITFPIRPLSKTLQSSACSCVLWTREYSRKTLGKPLTVASHYDPHGALV